MGDAVTKKCTYETYYAGLCGRPCDADRCSDHEAVKCCSCGDKATRECDHEGQFVCGAPLCAGCVGTGGDSSRGLGWGFYGHTHVRKVDNASDGRGDD